MGGTEEIERAVGRIEPVHDWDVGGYRKNTWAFRVRENLEPLTLTLRQTSGKPGSLLQRVMLPPG